MNKKHHLEEQGKELDLLKTMLKIYMKSYQKKLTKKKKDTSLGEKIRTLFREQGIMIASVLTAIGMAIGVLIEALLPGGGDGTAVGGGLLLRMKKA